MPMRLLAHLLSRQLYVDLIYISRLFPESRTVMTSRETRASTFTKPPPPQPGFHLPLLSPIPLTHFLTYHTLHHGLPGPDRI